MKVLVCSYADRQTKGVSAEQIKNLFAKMVEQLLERLKASVLEPSVFGARIHKFLVYFSNLQSASSHEIVQTWKDASEGWLIMIPGTVDRKPGFYVQESPAQEAISSVFGRACGFVEHHLRACGEISNFVIKKRWSPDYSITETSESTTGAKSTVTVFKIGEKSRYIWHPSFLQVLGVTDTDTADAMFRAHQNA